MGPASERVRQLARRILPFASGVLTALVALLLYNLVFPSQPQITMREVNDAVAAAMASATPPPAYSRRVYEIIRPSLVLIQTYGRNASGESEDGLGSGVIINQSGEILTSLHVVENALDIELLFYDGTRSTARIAAAQPENDIAVLSADTLPEQVIPAVLGSAGAMQVGDEAFVVGNPFGLYGSMSAGVISGFNRSFQPPDEGLKLEGLIQVDAAVNPGNSGGPLLNRYGQVVGIVVGIVNPTEQDVFIGIGFAVPISTAAEAAGLPPH